MGVVLKALDNPYFVALYEGAGGEAKRLEVRATVRSVTSNADRAGTEGEDAR
jgi:ABC-type sugar transport system substrate-binding protein